MSHQVWTKLFRYKVYIIVYVDPYTHSKCYEGCCGQGTHWEVKGVATTEAQAVKLIARLMKRVNYVRTDRTDFKIIEKVLDGELS